MKTFLKFPFALLMLFTLVVTVVSCKDDDGDDKPDNTVQETVTSLNLRLDAPKGKQDVAVLFTNPEGINGKTATNTLTLDANTLYTGTITLEDETKTPKADVSNQYTVSYQVIGSDVSIIANGLQPQVQTRATTTTNATLIITLIKGSTTLSTTFPLVIRL